MSFPTSLSRAHPRPHYFEHTPNAPFARIRPIENISIRNLLYRYLEYCYVSKVVEPPPSAPTGSVAPRIRLPFRPDSYLKVSGIAKSVEPSAIITLVLDLGRPETFSQISMIGDLLIPPEWDDRGPISNFGLPKTLKVWSVKSDDDPLDEWILCGETTNFLGLWGWTPFSFRPATSRYICLGFSELPQMQIKSNISVSFVRIARLAVHGISDMPKISPRARFSPVSAFSGAFERSPRFWTDLGINAPDPVHHQSIYKDTSSDAIWTTTGYSDMLPSSLAGMPVEYPHIATGQYLSLFPHYSGVVTSNKGKTALTLQITEGSNCYIRGVDLLEPYPRRGENGGHPAYYRIEILATDNPEVAFSSDFSNVGWKTVAQTTENLLFGTVALSPYFPRRVEFSRPIRCRFLRLIFYLPSNLSDYRRLELSHISLLMDRDFSLEPWDDHDLMVSEISVRLMGRTLLDDYGRFNRTELMDLRLEQSLSNRPWLEFLNVRNLLDVRERTRNQIFSNPRSELEERFIESVRGEHTDTSISRYNSQIKTYEHRPIGTPWGMSMDKYVSLVEHAGGVTNVDRWFVKKMDRPLTHTLGVGFIGSYSTSWQDSGGKTKSSTTGVHERIENRWPLGVYRGTETLINTPADPAIVKNRSKSSSDYFRKVTRTQVPTELDTRIVRSKQVYFEGEPTDMILMSIPVRLRLRSNADGRGEVDRLRVAVVHLPNNIKMKVTYKGISLPPEVDHGD